MNAPASQARVAGPGPGPGPGPRGSSLAFPYVYVSEGCFLHNLVPYIRVCPFGVGRGAECARATGGQACAARSCRVRASHFSRCLAGGAALTCEQGTRTASWHLLVRTHQGTSHVSCDGDQGGLPLTSRERHPPAGQQAHGPPASGASPTPVPRLCLRDSLCPSVLCESGRAWGPHRNPSWLRGEGNAGVGLVRPPARSWGWQLYFRGIRMWVRRASLG